MVLLPVNVNARFVLAVLPVYFNVPPLSIRLEAAVLDAPRLPATPPLPMVATERIPALTVVTPV